MTHQVTVGITLFRGLWNNGKISRCIPGTLSIDWLQHARKRLYSLYGWFAIQTKLISHIIKGLRCRWSHKNKQNVHLEKHNECDIGKWLSPRLRNFALIMDFIWGIIRLQRKIILQISCFEWKECIAEWFYSYIVCAVCGDKKSDIKRMSL